VRIHHISAGTLCPVLGRALLRLRDGKMVCHCLLIESDDGLVLVDTGFGLGDLADPAHKLGLGFKLVTRPAVDPAQTAIRQIEALGFRAADVRHIIVTHLDLDHAGGIPDFPGAQLHCYRPEHDAAVARATFVERERYRPHQIAGARFVLHEADGEGERWFGFQAVKPIAGLEVALVPLVGHTRGHAGVAVHGPDGWLLHCGDAYFASGEMDVAHPNCPPPLRLFQSLMAIDDSARRANQARLRELIKGYGSEVRVFCAHDPSEFAAFAPSRPNQAAA
jgi:glyoxylase-like metal-dependent hydrolase (beta-lactamase superfamily II)